MHILDGGGWRTLGRGEDPYGGRSSAGPSCLRVATGDFSRVAYAEFLPDERKGTCIASMARCLHFIEGYNWECPHSACGAALLCRASSA